MTNYLENMPIGSKITIGDMKRRMQYFGDGLVNIDGKIEKKVRQNSKSIICDINFIFSGEVINFHINHF